MRLPCPSPLLPVSSAPMLPCSAYLCILRLTKGGGCRWKDELVTTIFAHNLEQGDSVNHIVLEIYCRISHGEFNGCLGGKVNKWSFNLEHIQFNTQQILNFKCLIMFSHFYKIIQNLKFNISLASTFKIHHSTFLLFFPIQHLKLALLTKYG